MKKVLIVNDCRFEGIIMKDIINKLGFNVKVTNEYGALKEVKEFSPNIIIANLIMKETTGDELINKVKSLDSNIYGMLSSCNNINKNDYKLKGVDEVIQTPVDINLLKKALKIKETKNREGSLHMEFSFCPFCGKKLEEVQYKFCPYCGSEISKV